MVLRGTRRMAGTAYVLPRVRLGLDADGRPIFHVLHDAQGYLVTAGLYFPDGSDNGANQADDGRNYRPDCTFAEIKEKLNATLPVEEQIRVLAPLPVSRVVARIPLAEDNAIDFAIGSESTAIVDLVGKDKLIHARVNDENHFRTFVALLRSTGFQVEVNFYFTAQTTSIARASVDLSESGAAVDAAFSGAGATTGGIILEGDLRTRVAAALRSARISVEVDGDADFQKYADEIIKKLIVDSPEIQFKEATVPGADRDHDPVRTNPPAGQSTPGQNGEGGESPEGTTEEPADATSGGGATSQSSGAASLLPRFRASAAVAAIKRVSRFEINLANTGAGSEYLYTTHATLKTSQMNANREPYLLTGAGPSESGKKVLQYEEDIAPGAAFYVVATSRRVRNITYAYHSVDYKTVAEVKAARISSRFKLLREYPDSIYDSESGFPRAYMYQSAFWWSANSWGFETLEPEFSNEDYAQLPSNSIKDMDYVQVAFTNSAGAPINPQTNRPYGGIPLNMLAAEGQRRGAWDAELDEANNRVLLVARQRLGRMTIANNETFPTTNRVSSGDADLYEKRYFQATWGAMGGRYLDKTVYSSVGDKLALPTKQSSIKLQILPVTLDSGVAPSSASPSNTQDRAAPPRYNVDIVEDFGASSVGRASR